MKPVKNAVSFVIFAPETGEHPSDTATQPEGPPQNGRRSRKILTVRRPEDDEELPGVWGLPAGSLLERETFPDGVVRAGEEKLGVELEVEEILNDGQTERDEHVLYMKLFRARIVEGTPTVPQEVGAITQYTEWEWADPERLRVAAANGSLCSRLLLDYLDLEQ